ncbi:MAG TPA: type II secretion system F family protein [Actinomycetota bacterium]|nr:type II secretion system F family protein [Actinomycetota bacterium]
MSVVLLCVGCWLLLPARSRGRLPRSPGRRLGLTASDSAAAFAGLGVAVLLGGPLGMGLGIAAAWALRQGLNRLADGGGARREELARQAPEAIDCLASCLAAGAPLWSAMPVVADAFGDPVAGVLRRCVGRHALGSPHEEVFAELVAEPELAPVGRVLLRAVESGAALTSSLVSCAEQMRHDRAAELERRARAVGVKAVAPLGVCFLPAFMLLAVVPIVGSLLRSLF